MTKSLNDREIAFAKEFIRNGANAYKAALSAGYSPKTARYASKWLNPQKPSGKSKYKPQLREYIDQLIEEAESEKTATPKEILEYFSSVVRGESQAQIVVTVGTGDGCSEAIRVMKNPDEKERLKAAELLGRAYGIFNDRLNISEPVPVILSGADELEE